LQSPPAPSHWSLCRNPCCPANPRCSTSAAPTASLVVSSPARRVANSSIGFL
jgi:hypothetical protein